MKARTFEVRPFFEMLSDEVPERVAQLDGRELERLAGNGDEMALKAIMVKYGPDVMKKLKEHERGAGRRDELAMDVFMRVYSALPNKPADSPLKAWILTIARNVGVDEQRKGGRRRKSQGVEVELSNAIETSLSNDGLLRQKPDQPNVSDHDSKWRERVATMIQDTFADSPVERTVATPVRTDFDTAAEWTPVPCGEADSLSAAMTYLAVLAYPEKLPDRDRAILAMQTLMLREAKKAGREMPEGAAASFKAMPVQQQDGTLRRLNDRLNYRLIAAQAMNGLLTGARKPGATVPMSRVDQQATKFLLLKAGMSLTVAKAKTPTTRRERGDFYGVNDFAAMFCKSPRDFFRMVWTPEVMHLAMAFQVLSCRWDDPRGWGIFPLLANPGWVAELLARGEKWARILAVAGQLVPALNGMRPERQIRLIPA